MKSLILFLVALVLFCGCQTNKKAYLADRGSNLHSTQPDKSQLTEQIFLIGDAGGLDTSDDKNIVFESAKSHIQEQGGKASLFFLGDNAYESGLGKKNDPERPKQEKILDAHLSLSKYFSNTYFVAGNHDWNNNKSGGLKAIRRQYKYVKAQTQKEDNVHYYPKKGCGDPEVVKVSKDLVYIFIDTQWWVHNWSKEPEINKGCSIKSKRAFLDYIRDILIENKNKKILIVMHHPLLSNGNHGGHFGFKDHLFPLTKFSDKLVVPLPFLGSLYPVSRQLGATNQDVAHSSLNELKTELEHVIRFSDVSRVTFISGHDHLLQHNAEQYIFQKYPINYIISGSGYKTGYAARGLNASFVQSARGYGVLEFYKDGSTWLKFYSVDEQSNRKLEYTNQLHASKPSYIPWETIDSDTTTRYTSIKKAPNKKYEKGKGYEFIMGQQYRPVWTTPVETEVFRLGRYFGGLKPLKKGGGLYTHTLRLENPAGQHYVLRSINKDFFKAVPKDLRHLELMKLYADQNTASIPYGALYVSKLSEYAGVYHSDPKLVYLDDTSQLGAYQDYFEEGHYLLEARPDGDWSDSPLFGQSKNIIGYNDLLYNLRTKTSHFVDQKWILKSRVFDTFIHDRDRHDDQWRWAAFDEGDKTIYRPVPRDRDMAFFKYGGVIPSLIGNVADKKFKTFKGDHIDVKSLATNVNNFDRYFLNDLTWNEWEEVIDTFTSNMSDEAIENSVIALPAESHSYINGEIIGKLKSRIKILKSELKKYYDFIAKEIEFTGSDKDDVVVIDVIEDGNLVVHIYRNSKKYGLVEKHHRVIYHSETEELRLYGLEGDDQFRINLEGDTPIKIRLIGGVGNDTIIVNGDYPKTVSEIAIYDDEDVALSSSSTLEDHIEESSAVNKYDRLGYMYDSGLPWLTLGYAPDEGFRFGFGYMAIKHGWRQSPFKSSHLFNSEFTTGIRFSAKARYEGEYPHLFGKKLGLAPSVYFERPDNLNYFGLGASEFNRQGSSSDNFVQISSLIVNGHLQYRAGAGKIRLRFGPTFESFNVESTLDSFNVLNVLEISSVGEDIERDNFVGLHSDIRIMTTDRIDKPSRGILLRSNFIHQYHTRNKNNTLKYGLSFAWYTSPFKYLDVVFASNTGFESIIGSPLFYQYPAMGNKAHLRPFRNERHRGATILYQQFDLRFKLFSWNNSVLPFEVGGIAGYDFGQNYFNGEDTGNIKHGWTLGLSYDLLGYFVIRTSVSGSGEGQYFKFDVGYAF